MGIIYGYGILDVIYHIQRLKVEPLSCTLPTQAFVALYFIPMHGIHLKYDKDIVSINNIK